MGTGRPALAETEGCYPPNGPEQRPRGLRFITGGTLGVDTWAAEAVWTEREAGADIRLEVTLPFPGYQEHLCGTGREDFRRILRCADAVIQLPGGKSLRESLTVRDCFVVDQSELLIAVYDERSGIKSGTYRTVEIAQSKAFPSYGYDGWIYRYFI
jgi:uncharacterized phage-like protein YoqJ